MKNINVNDIKKEYPLSYKKVGEFLLAGVKIPEMEEIFGENDVEIYLELALVNSPRFLFDFFDKEEIYVNIWTFDKEDWRWGIQKMINDIPYKSRAEAEQMGFIEAFKELENKSIENESL